MAAIVVNDISTLTLETIWEIHRRIMRNCPQPSLFDAYVIPGNTRASTGATVMIGSGDLVQCCPYREVDNEMDIILSIARVASYSSK